MTVLKTVEVPQLQFIVGLEMHLIETVLKTVEVPQLSRVWLVQFLDKVVETPVVVQFFDKVADVPVEKGLGGAAGAVPAVLDVPVIVQ